MILSYRTLKGDVMTEKVAFTPEEEQPALTKRKKGRSMLRNLALASMLLGGRPATQPVEATSAASDTEKRILQTQELLMLRKSNLAFTARELVRVFKPEKVKEVKMANGQTRIDIEGYVVTSDPFKMLIAESPQLQKMQEDIKNGKIDPKAELKRLQKELIESVNSKLFDKDREKQDPQIPFFAAVTLTEAYKLAKHDLKEPIGFGGLEEGKILKADSLAEMQGYLLARYTEIYSYYRDRYGKDMSYYAAEVDMMKVFEAVRLGALERNITQGQK